MRAVCQSQIKQQRLASYRGQSTDPLMIPIYVRTAEQEQGQHFPAIITHVFLSITLLSRYYNACLLYLDKMDSNSPKKELYYSYLLRIWVESQKDSDPIWRIMLLDPKTGEKKGFHSIEALLDFLTTPPQGSNHELMVSTKHVSE